MTLFALVLWSREEKYLTKSDTLLSCKHLQHISPVEKSHFH